MSIFSAQLITDKPEKSIVHEAHDFGGERVHIARTPAPGDPLPKFRCDRCNRTLPGEQFTPVSHTGKIAAHLGKFAHATICHPHCRTCRAQERGRWVRHELYSPKLDRYWQKATNSLRGSAKKRGILFGIDKDDALGLYLECRGICALTGLQTNWSAKGSRGRNGRNYKAPSLDRIDSNGNYVLGNLQIVMQVVNIMKNDLPDDVFIDLCRQIAEHNMFR